MAKVNKFLRVLGVFSGKSETEGGKILIYFWKVYAGGGQVVQVVPAFWRAHWVQVVRLFGGSGPAGGWLWSSGRVFPLFVLSLALSLVRCT